MQRNGSSSSWKGSKRDCRHSDSWKIVKVGTCTPNVCSRTTTFWALFCVWVIIVPTLGGSGTGFPPSVVARIGNPLSP